MSGRVGAAFRAVPRKHFVRPDDIVRAHMDQPLPIGHGQTISQPYTVRRMLEWLDVQPGQRILDVGSGSGWTSALLSHLTGNDGCVVAIERIPDLIKFGRDNCDRFGCKNIEFHQAGKQFGWPGDTPYDRILVSASIDRLPDELVQQLKPGGKMVIPIGESIYEIIKTPDNRINQREHPGFVFVPLLPG
jgi:protein-L-isoaspartate(D-aspartate) O-methyltransferase